METTYIAQLLGLAFIILGVIMIIRRKVLMSVFRDIFNDKALTFTFGVALLFVGLSLGLTHNFSSAREIIISIFAWHLVIESLIYLVSSKKILKFFLRWLEQKKIYFLVAIVEVVLGGYLAYTGFFIQ